MPLGSIAAKYMAEIFAELSPQVLIDLQLANSHKEAKVEIHNIRESTYLFSSRGGVGDDTFHASTKCSLQEKYDVILYLKTNRFTKKDKKLSMARLLLSPITMFLQKTR